MGSALTKEESAVVKILQHILSKRGVSYDAKVLKKLLMWVRELNLIPGVGAAFELPIWEAVGQSLWEEISSGNKTVGRFSTLWRLVRETLQEMKSERTVAASTFTALTPATPSASGNAMLLSNNVPNLFENRIRMPPLWAVRETMVAEMREAELAEKASEETLPEVFGAHKGPCSGTRSSSPTPLLKQGHLEEAAHDHVGGS